MSPTPQKILEVIEVKRENRPPLRFTLSYSGDLSIASLYLGAKKRFDENTALLFLKVTSDFTLTDNRLTDGTWFADVYISETELSECRDYIADLLVYLDGSIPLTAKQFILRVADVVVDLGDIP